MPDSLDRKSTRLNSSHQIISYAVFCLKKKKILTIVKEGPSEGLAYVEDSTVELLVTFMEGPDADAYLSAALIRISAYHVAISDDAAHDTTIGASAHSHSSHSHTTTRSAHLLTRRHLLTLGRRLIPSFSTVLLVFLFILLLSPCFFFFFLNNPAPPEIYPFPPPAALPI